jgi:hypothetical protein
MELMEIFKMTFRELEQNPSLARQLLLGLWFQRLTQMQTPCADRELDSMTKLFFEWIFARRPLTREVADKLLRQQPDAEDFERLLILTWVGKRGRPITKRRAAIEALFRRDTCKNHGWKSPGVFAHAGILTPSREY